MKLIIKSINAVTSKKKKLTSKTFHNNHNIVDTEILNNVWTTFFTYTDQAYNSNLSGPYTF